MFSFLLIEMSSLWRVLTEVDFGWNYTIKILEDNLGCSVESNTVKNKNLEQKDKVRGN